MLAYLAIRTQHWRSWSVYKPDHSWKLGQWVRWVNKPGWVTWVMGHHLWPIDPWPINRWL